MSRNETYAQYRRNLSDFNRWEQQEDERQKEAIAALHRREREAQPGYTVPTWVVIVGAILLTSFLSWVFITLAFSQKG